MLNRIERDTRIFNGKPNIRGHRLAVEHIFQMLGAGSNIEELLTSYPWLEKEDIQACFLYAAKLMEQ